MCVVRAQVDGAGLVEAVEFCVPLVVVVAGVTSGVASALCMG